MFPTLFIGRLPNTSKEVLQRLNTEVEAFETQTLRKTIPS